MAIFQGTVEQIENNINKSSKVIGAGTDEYPTCKAVEDYVTTEVGNCVPLPSNPNNVESTVPVRRPEGDFRYIPVLTEVLENTIPLRDEDGRLFGPSFFNLDFSNVEDTEYTTFDMLVTYVGQQVGEIETALDAIINIQESLIGGAK